MVIIFLKTLEKKKGVDDVRPESTERRLVRPGTLFEFGPPTRVNAMTWSRVDNNTVAAVEDEPVNKQSWQSKERSIPFLRVSKLISYVSSLRLTPLAGAHADLPACRAPPQLYPTFKSASFVTLSLTKRNIPL